MSADQPDAPDLPEPSVGPSDAVGESPSEPDWQDRGDARASLEDALKEPDGDAEGGVAEDRRETGTEAEDDARRREDLDRANVPPVAGVVEVPEAHDAAEAHEGQPDRDAPEIPDARGQLQGRVDAVTGAMLALGAIVTWAKQERERRNG